MMRIINRGLDRFADAWGAFFSSKWTVLLFALIPLIAVGQAVRALVTGDMVTFIAWLSSNYMQLVALPVLAYIARRGERSRADLHEKVDALHEKIEEAAR